MFKVTVTPYGQFSIKDYNGTDAYQLDHQFVSKSFSAGDPVEPFYVTQSQYDNGIRQELEKYASMRVQVAAGSVRTKPLMTYVVEDAPGERPRFHQVETVALSLGGGAQSCVIRGENLIAGRKATAVVGLGTSQIVFTAARKGPIGQNVTVNIKAAASASSIEIVHGDDGIVTINITPLTGSMTANAIAALVAASAATLKFVSAVGGGTGAVPVTSGIVLSHAGHHAGAGQAFVDLPSTVTRTRLRVEFLRPGNGGNLWSVKLNAASGGGSVTVDTAAHTIVVVPATGGGNQDASVVATQINADTTALKYVLASVVGTNGDDMGVTDTYYMYGGCGEDVVATIGGAVADVIAYTDTAMTLQVTGTALGTAGCADGEDAIIDVLLDNRVLPAQIGVVA